MTKEELEKEADDYVANTDTSICEFEGIVTIICDGEGNVIDADSIAKSAYLAGAEPMEKRIEQLEKEIKRLETELAITDNDREHNYYECLDLYKKVEELEKENAELKLEIEKLNNKIDELEQRVPKWHNLRKDPEDLPKEYMGFLFVKTNMGTYRLDMFINGFMQDMGVTKTIAWCETPKYEEE
jgi:hypothetical protein